MRSAQAVIRRIILASALIYCAAHGLPNDMKYVLKTTKHFSDKRIEGHVELETLQFIDAANIEKNALAKINAHLRLSRNQFIKSASDCLYAEPGKLWHYHLKFEKYIRSNDYISVVFNKDAICAGSPNFDKEVRVYSLSTGEHITAKALFKAVFPLARNFYADSSAELVRLDDEMAERLIDDSSNYLKEFDATCSKHLRFTAYRLWIDSTHAIFYPEFNQGKSGCQREYVVKRYVRRSSQ